jgi:carbon monoxide dehydrogenase subunit G
MELTNEFRVGVPVDRAWTVLNDVERIAPCLPGAQLQEIEGDEYRGVVKVKVGPITANYKGVATFLTQDEAAGTLVLRAEGRETRGQGNANATVTATLVADGDSTTVTVVTDLTITGKVAQFGRGVLADVSGKLIGQFVECLESKVLAADAPVTTADAPEVAPTSAAGLADAVGDAAEALSSNGDSSAVPADAADAAMAASGPTAAAGTTATATVPPADEAPATAATKRVISSSEPEAVNLLDAAGAPLAKRVAPVIGVLFVLWLLRRLLGSSKG